MAISPSTQTPDAGSKAATRPWFTTFELLLLGMFAALVVLSNVALRLPVRMPGHSGVVWMALLTTVRVAVAKPGAGLATGVLSGLLAMLLGVGDKGALNTLLGYSAAGLGVDAVLSLVGAGASGARRVVSCAVAGLAGNLAKFSVKLLLQVLVGVPVGFVMVGESFSLATHTGFGLLGGVLGALVLGGLERAGYFAYLRARR